MAADRRRWLGWATLALVVAGSAAMATLSRPPAPIPSALPVELDITLLRDHSELGNESEPVIVRVTDEYVLRFASWTDWTLFSTCCPDPFAPRIDPTGDSKQQRPDGTVWHHDAQPAAWARFLPNRMRRWVASTFLGGGEWELISDDRHAGSSPWPAFAPPWDAPTAIPERGLAVAEKLGLDPDDLSARRGGGLIRTFYDPLGIPIHAFTEEEGRVTHEMTVTAIRSD